EAFSERHEKNGEDAFAKNLQEAAPDLNSVDYQTRTEKFLRPASLPELLRLVNQLPDARLIAGATELGLDITKRYKKFPTLISVEAVPDLTAIQSNASEWQIGAAATLTAIE